MRTTAGWWRDRAQEYERYGSWPEAERCYREAASHCQSVAARAFFESKAASCRERMERKPASDGEWWDRD